MEQGEDLPGNAGAGTVYQGIDWDFPGPESPQHLCWGAERAALLLRETFLGKTKSSKELQEQGSPSLPWDIAAGAIVRGVHRVTLCPRHCQGLMGAAQQSQDRAGTGTQHCQQPWQQPAGPSLSLYCPNPASLAGHGCVPAEPTCAQGQRGGSHSHEQHNDSWGG